jgi:TRAP-type transport system periplasmic protein
MSRSLVKAIFASLFISMGSAHAADGVITLTLGTWGAQSHPHEKEFVRLFIDTAERESQGRLKFRYFPNGSMVKQDDVATAVPNGLVDIALTIIDSWAGNNHDVSVTTTPLWTLSMTDANSQLMLGQPIYEYFSSLLQRDKVKLLCLFDIGPPVIASKFPLERPEDLDGKVVRALSKGTAEDLVALKASPIVMGVGQVYPALQRHTVDGAMNGVQGSVGLRYYEVAEYEMATGGALGTIISGYVMNLRKFESLPEDLRSVIVNAASQTRSHTQQYLIDSYPNFLKEAADHGMKIYELKKDTPMWDVWQASMSSYKETLRSSYSPEVISLLPK